MTLIFLSLHRNYLSDNSDYLTIVHMKEQGFRICYFILSDVVSGFYDSFILRQSGWFSQTSLVKTRLNSRVHPG